MIEIDGSQGEGGGQILRSSLALSLVTGTPFRIDRIRAGRAKPGLLRQHLTAVQAAAAIGGAETVGATIGSTRLDFMPGKMRAGTYGFAVGSAGSAMLVLQTVLPALLTFSEPVTLTVEGGTHNPFAPPFDFIERAFLPLLARMGARVTVALERTGFYPAGGGKFTVQVEPSARLARLDLVERGALRAQRARALIAHLDAQVAERELTLITQKLGWPRASMERISVKNSPGPGNALLIELEHEHITEIFTGFGEKGRSAEDVANLAIEQARGYLASTAPVGEHLADQLLLPMALGSGGSFVTSELTPHTTTNIDVIQRFLPDVSIRVETRSDGTRLVGVER